MSVLCSRQIRLKTRPAGIPAADHFELVECDMPAPGIGEILCKTLYLSLDPYMRGQISGRHISGTIDPGDLMRGETVSEVVVSNSPDFEAGELVCHYGGWQTYSLTTAEGVSRVDARLRPASLALGIMGMPGLTAYAGLFYLAEVKPRDVVLVSAASGAVGSLVGQMAKIQGCRVIGIAGSEEKCAWLRQVAGFDGCINYKTQPLSDALRQECPDGVDVYFDNVGGAILDAAMDQLAIGARVVLCGLMAQYNTDNVLPGPTPATIIRSRATVRGLVVYDHFDKQQEFLDRVLPWLEAGKIKYREDVSCGLAQAPAAFARLMQGRNFGKTIIKVA
ncbi:NADP-dependent oxidoreductase [Luteithermobacter gelatinilyticus]|uniref:NADP-dependent oxidoreductase n=1 Tax=Luteithermobacter gelatinilyticus TaxID=2582913 RepID=UPI001AEFBFE5|nr:NADP-dependent oxidoreductase [Luteithermobacter gelatinilyticus]